MRILVVEDEFTSQCLLRGYLDEFGRVDIVRDGEEALAAFTTAHADQAPYDLMLLDIMMPGRNGHEVLKRIRALEERQGLRSADCVKVIMVTALNDKKNIFQAFKEQCEAYLIKPVDRVKILEQMGKLGFEITQLEDL